MRPLRRPETDGTNRLPTERQRIGDARLGTNQRRTLEALASGPLTVGELARELGVPYADARRLTFRLSERGLVTVDGSPRTARLSG